MVKLREEKPNDSIAIDELLNICFGSDRFTKASYQFRSNRDPIKELSFVAEDDTGRIVATIRYWPISLADQTALLLGPIAVDPALHKRGIGKAMVFTTLAKAESLHYNVIFLVGDPEYYRQFGFRTAPSSIIMSNEVPGRLQYRLLGDGQLPSVKCQLTASATAISHVPFSGDKNCKVVRAPGLRLSQ